MRINPRLSELLATGLYVSHIPYRITGFRKFTGSGMAGTLLALLAAVLLPENPWGYALLLALFLPFSVVIAGEAERIYGTHLGLSKARARRASLAVQDALGLPSAAIEVDGKGAAQPIASNESDRGRALNRRVEVEFWYDDALQELSDEPQLCPEDAGAETVTRVYEPPSGGFRPIRFEAGKPVIEPGLGERLRNAMADIRDKANVRLRFVGYTSNERLDRRTAMVYGDDIGLSAARADREVHARVVECAEGRNGKIERLIRMVFVRLGELEIRADDGHEQTHRFGILQLRRNAVELIEFIQEFIIGELVKFRVRVCQMRRTAGGNKKVIWHWKLLRAKFTRQFKSDQAAHAVTKKHERLIEQRLNGLRQFGHHAWHVFDGRFIEP